MMRVKATKTISYSMTVRKRKLLRMMILQMKWLMVLLKYLGASKYFPYCISLAFILLKLTMLWLFATGYFVLNTTKEKV
jgi:hypothetical protein